MTVETWLTDWLALRKAELKPRTIESYSQLFAKYVIPTIGQTEIESLNPNDLRHLLASITGSGHTRTAEYLYTVLKAAFRDLDRNPLQKIKRPRHVQQSPEPWNDQQRAVYLAACKNHRHGLILSLILLLGLRRGEACGLKWCAVDLDRQLVHIVNQRIKLATGEIIDTTPKSATSVRAIPLPDQIIPQLRAARGLPQAYVDPIAPHGLDQAHRKLVKSLGLPAIPLHGLRHSMATSAVRNGADLRSLQDVMGHASYATTANRYTHPDETMHRAVIDRSSTVCYTNSRNT